MLKGGAGGRTRTPGETSPVELAPAQLAETIGEFLAEHPAAVVLEDGQVLFEMRTARFSATESHGRCLLQFWSDERNLIRTVVGLQARAQSLRVSTRRMGVTRPQTLELVPSIDRRTPTARDTARRQYQRLLERAVTRRFLGARIEGLRSATDLEHSFGPAYARGRLVHGTAVDTIIGVGSAESSTTIDGILTLGILWLNYCRQHAEARRHVGGLKVFVPAGTARTTAERMAWLNHSAARFELFTLDEHTEELEEVDFRDTGNLESHLVHAFSRDAVIERCRTGLDRFLNLVPADARPRVEIQPHSAGEVGLLLHGLEFARVRHGLAANSFRRDDELTFGAGANETPLTAENESLCRDLVMRLFLSRQPGGRPNDALFRLQPERWLESRLRSHLAEMLPGLRGELLYSQVPALSSAERGMLDLLTVDQRGSLHVIEVKADEDLHLPLQALDYWIRVRALNEDRQSVAGSRPLSAFERHGYFPGVELAPADPGLLLIAPALRIHPANEIVLRHLAPQVPWELIALGENWRRDLNVVFRKHSSR